MRVLCTGGLKNPSVEECERLPDRRENCSCEDCTHKQGISITATCEAA